MRYASTIALTVFGLVLATVFAVPVSVDASPAEGQGEPLILPCGRRLELQHDRRDGGRMVRLREVLRRIPAPVRTARGGSRRQRRGSDRQLRGMPAGQARR